MHSDKNNNNTKSHRLDTAAHLLIPDGIPHVKGVVLQGVLGLYSVLVGLVLTLVLLCLLDHALNLVLAEAALVIGDGNLVLVTCKATR